MAAAWNTALQEAPLDEALKATFMAYLIDRNIPDDRCAALLTGTPQQVERRILALLQPAAAAAQPPAAPPGNDVEERLRKLELQVNRGRAGAHGAGLMHTSSYEQLYNNHPKAQKDIRELRGTQLPSIAETMPKLPGHNVSENNKMLPDFMSALATLPGARSESKAVKVDGKGKGGMRVARVHVGSFVVEDTHDQYYLDSAAPDVTILKPGYASSGFNAVAVIELQAGRLDNKHRGKAIKYGQLLLKANPRRAFSTIVLTNTVALQVCQVSRSATSDDEYDVVFSNELLLANNGPGWQYLVGLLKSRDAASCGYNVPSVTLDGKAFTPVGFLGSGRGVEVYSVQAAGSSGASSAGGSGVAAHHAGGSLSTGSGTSSIQSGSSSGGTGAGELMACKMHTEERARSYASELHALQAIRKDPPTRGALQLPQLVAADSAQRLLLTTPVVKALGAPGRVFGAGALDSLIRGLQYLHTVLKIVHRDLEPKHLGWGPSGLALIDFSSAASLQLGQSPAGQARGYSGTLMFASTSVLDALAAGAECDAHVAQDLVAMVKTVYVLVHPDAQEGLMHAATKALGEARHVQGKQPELHKATCTVKQFWSSEIDRQTPAGAHWWRLLELAERAVNPPDPAYAASMKHLQEGLACQLRPAS